nr:hypothetical protein Iba_chr01dCG0770 [Ipomoea batatas]
MNTGRREREKEPNLQTRDASTQKEMGQQQLVQYQHQEDRTTMTEKPIEGLFSARSARLRTANCEDGKDAKRQSATSEAPTSDGDPASPVLSVSVAASSELRSTVLSVVYWEITVIIIDESDLMIYGVSKE